MDEWSAYSAIIGWRCYKLGVNAGDLISFQTFGPRHKKCEQAYNGRRSFIDPRRRAAPLPPILSSSLLSRFVYYVELVLSRCFFDMVQLLVSRMTPVFFSTSKNSLVLRGVVLRAVTKTPRLLDSWPFYPRRRPAIWEKFTKSPISASHWIKVCVSQIIWVL